MARIVEPQAFKHGVWAMDVEGAQGFDRDKHSFEVHRSQEDQMFRLSAAIVGGADLFQALDLIYESFADLVPYDRIGFAEIDSDGTRATARWARSKGRLLLRVGYSAPLAGSSLSVVLAQKRPRVLNNLPEYLKHRPGSKSTGLMVNEGCKSSMTCPMYQNDSPVAFLFFTSFQPDTYTEDHVRLLKHLAMQLALLLMISKTKKPSIKQPSPAKKNLREEQIAITQKSTHETPSVLRPESDHRFLSQLKPGMVLLEAIRMQSGALLVSAGTELTETSIDRLIAMNTKGFLKIEQLRIKL